MDRNTLQKLAAERLASSGRLMCQWATGTGKSGVLLRFLKNNPETDCLILVPEQNNIENWRDEFSKFGVPMELVRVVCYASLHKYANTAWDIVVFDEAPHMDTDKRRAICRSIRGKYILALGAVIDKDETEALESVYGHFDKSYVSFRQAIDWGILKPPTVRILHMKLDNTKKTVLHKGHSYTAQEYYNLIDKKVDEAVTAYNQSENPFNRQRMYRAGNERKRFLGKQKDTAIASVCEKIQAGGKRFLCFCSSIKQAEKLGKEHAFTSKTPASMRLLERFNNHEIDSLYVVGKLIEGQNLKDIDCGILVQLGGTNRITVQECGRIMRSQNPEIYVPVFDSTKDDSFLYTITNNIPAEYISHYNY